MTKVITVSCGQQTDHSGASPQAQLLIGSENCPVFATDNDTVIFIANQQPATAPSEVKSRFQMTGKRE